jgi:hypothetical protein
MTATRGGPPVAPKGSGMWRYYLVLFAAFAAVLAYTYVADPCNRLLRSDFLRMRPGHVLLRSDAEAGSPEIVHCRVRYRTPLGEQAQEDVWVYQYRDTAWELSRIVREPAESVQR